MRINPNPLPDLLSSIALTEKQINTDLLQISSGQSINQPSDNPAGAALLAQNAAQPSRADQFLRSIGSVQGEMQNADSALNSVVTILQRAITLGVEGANGTLNASDRQALAVEAEGIRDQLLSLANLTYQGNFVFAGTATQITNHNQLASSAGTSSTPITAATQLTGTTEFTAGGKTFSFTANQTNGTTVADLVAAINDPNDPAGLHAELGTVGSGSTATTQLIVTDSNGNNNVAVGAGNTETALGSYTNPTSAPYMLDASGVHYMGNDNTNSITLGNGFTVQTNLPGSHLFAGNGSDMFQGMQDLISSLQSGTGIDSAVTEVSSSYQNLTGQRAFFGSAIQQLGSQETFLNGQETQLAQQQNTIGATDFTKVISNLQAAQVSRQATLEAMAQTLQTNLFNYLK